MLGALRQTARQLWKRPGYTGAAVFTMGAGIAIAIAAFGVVRAYLLRPLPYPDADRLVSVIFGPARDTNLPFPDGFGEASWAGLGDVFEATVTWDLDGYTVLRDEGSTYVSGQWVSPGFFEALGVTPALGRGLTAEDSREAASVAVISHELWVRDFGGRADVLGRPLRLFSTDRPDEEGVFTIVGVLPPDQWHLNRFTDVLLPLVGDRSPYLARLAPGVSIAVAEDRVNALILPQLTNVAPGWRLTLTSLHDEHVHEARPAIVVLAGAAALMLLIGAVNAGGLLLTRSAARRREMALRAALGASRATLAGHVVLESLLLGAAAAVAGALGAVALLDGVGAVVERQLGATVPGGIARLGMDLPLLLAGVTLALGTALLSGLAAAVAGSRTDLRASMATPSTVVTTGRGGGLGHGRLIVAQLAITMTLLFGAGLMLRTIQNLAGVAVGFTSEEVLKAEILIPLARFPEPPDREALMARVTDGVARDLGVPVGAVFPYPFRPGPTVDVAARDGTPVTSQLYTVTDGYFGIVGVPLVAGRLFDATDRADGLATAMVSGALARRLWADESEAVGRQLAIAGEDQARLVVGVVGDVRESLTGPDVPDLYVPYAQNPRRFVALVAAGATPDRLAAAILDVDPTLAPAAIATLDEIVGRESDRQRLLASLLAGFGALAMVLAMLGLSTTLAYAVRRRWRELALRVVLGATGWGILRLVLRGGGRVLAWGIAAGVALGAGFARLMASQTFGVPPFDPVTGLVVSGGLGVLGVVALLVPALRVLRIQPAKVLQEQ